MFKFYDLTLSLFLLFVLISVVLERRERRERRERERERERETNERRETRETRMKQKLGDKDPFFKTRTFFSKLAFENVCVYVRFT